MGSGTSDGSNAAPGPDDLQGLKMHMSQSFVRLVEQSKSEGKMEGEATGLAKGKVKGEATLLQKMLERRFGALPTHVVAMVDGAPVEQIEIWADRFVDADRLEDVFRAQ